MELLEFELAYFDEEVQYVSHYATRSLSPLFYMDTHFQNFRLKFIFCN